jgi:hypothetical protein
MNAKSSELEAWERDQFAEAAPAIDALRRERAGCPPVRVLSAAGAQALPAEEQSAVVEHVASCRMCRDLQADLESLDPAVVAPVMVDQIFRQVRQQAEAESRPAGVSWRVWLLGSFAAAALVVVAVAGYQRGHQPAPAADVPPPVVATVPRPPVPPPADAPGPALEKPPVKLTMLALTWRGADRGASFAKEIAPALDAYRADRFDEAARKLGALAVHYPASVEIPFYQGVSLLLLGLPAEAIGPLRRANQVADDTFAADASWYLGIALQRAGQFAEARTRFSALCRGSSPYADRACSAAR